MEKLSHQERKDLTWGKDKKPKGMDLMMLMATAMMFNPSNTGLPDIGYAREKEKHICKNCQKEFVPESENKKTVCSAECAKIYYKLK